MEESRLIIPFQYDPETVQAEDVEVIIKAEQERLPKAIRSLFWEALKRHAATATG